MEGTLIDHNFSNLIWETDIPRLYGQQHGADLETARQLVLDEYKQVGDERPEWYDVESWFKRFNLTGDWRELPKRRREDCRVYPEAHQTLKRLTSRYTLIIASNTIRDFLKVQLSKLPAVFAYIFSATSDFGEVKKSEEFYSRICQTIGVPPRALVHVGDNRKFDYEAAKQLGIHAFYLDRTGDSEGEHVVHNLVEFEARVRKLSGKHPLEQQLQNSNKGSEF